MANELQIRLATGLTLYAQRTRASDGFVWSTTGAAYEAPLAANWANYDVALTEDSTTGYYRGNDPDTGTLGGYTVFRQAGGSPATTDPTVGVGALGNPSVAVASIAAGAVTDAAISTPAEAAGNPTTILAMVRRVFEWHRNKRTRNRTTGVVTLRNAADDGNLVTYTQSTASVTDTEGASS